MRITKDKLDIFEILDWSFWGETKDGNEFFIKVDCKGDVSPKGARGLIMSKLRGIEGKYYTREDYWM